MSDKEAYAAVERSARANLEAADQIADAVLNPSHWGHDGDWCRDCQEGCGEEHYGGPCYCCTAWWREEADDAP